MPQQRPCAKLMKPPGVWRLVPRAEVMQKTPAHSFVKPRRAHVMNKLTLSVLVAIASSAAVTGALAQDAAAGKTSFNKCLPCHAIGEGAKNKVGPSSTGLTAASRER